MNRIRLVSGILALALVLVAAACGDDESSGKSPSSTPTSSPSPTATTGPIEAPPVRPGSATESPAAFFLDISSPQNESVVRTSNLDVRGRTVVDAVVTVNGNTIDVDAAGNFSAGVQLAEGPNAIEVIASDFQGRQESRVISVIYVR